MFASVVKTTEAEAQYIDLPHIVTLLLNSKHEGQVYSPTPTYLVTRVIKMVNFNVTADASPRFCLIDLDTIEHDILVSFLTSKNYNVLYQGEAFILLQKNIYSNELDTSPE
jgi:hypothetical protein